MRTLLLVLVAASLTSCVRVARDPVTGRADVDVESPMQRGEAWEGELRGRGNWAAIRGTTRVTNVGEDVTATISMNGAVPGSMHPWHLHDGTCDTGGPIVGDPGAYPVLSVGSNGTSQASARVAAKLNEARKYHINVHQSRTQLGTIVACADLDD